MRSTKAPLLLLLVLTVIVGCKDLDRYPDAESVFHATFNSLPPQKVTGLQGDGHAFRDNSTNYLRFNAPPSTVRLLVGNTFGPTTVATFKAGISGQTPEDFLLETRLDQPPLRHLKLAFRGKHQLGGAQRPTPQPSTILPPVFIRLFRLVMHTILTIQTRS